MKNHRKKKRNERQEGSGKDNVKVKSILEDNYLLKGKKIKCKEEDYVRVEDSPKRQKTQTPVVTHLGVCYR